MKRMMILAGTAVALLVSGQLAAADGKATYDKSCAMCHKAMAPKMGDKAAWAPIIAQGADALTASVIKGKGKMKPRGGAAAATDEDLKAAVEYIISQNK
jgi:cytochrome c5